MALPDTRPVRVMKYVKEIRDSLISFGRTRLSFYSISSLIQWIEQKLVHISPSRATVGRSRPRIDGV